MFLTPFQLWATPLEKCSKVFNETWSKKWFLNNSKIPNEKQLPKFPRSPYSSKTKNPNHSDIWKWIKKNIKNGRVKFNNPLLPDAEEYIIYNWMRWPDNYENIRYGISLKNMSMFSSIDDHPKKLGHLGLYAAQDPWASFQFGDSAMEIVLYKGSFPQKTKGKVQHSKITSQQFSSDPTRGVGGGNQYFEAKKMSYVVRDPRIIKELRWPNRDAVLESWFRTTFENDNSKNEAMKKLGAHFLFAENFSISDRLEIILADSARLSTYLSSINQINWRGYDPFIQSQTNENEINAPAFAMVVFNNIFQALFRTNENFYINEGESFDLKFILKKYKNLPSEHKKIAQQVIQILEEGTWIGHFLKLIVAIDQSDSPSIKRHSTYLIKDMKSIKSELRSSIYSNTDVIDDEMKKLSDLIN